MIWELYRKLNHLDIGKCWVPNTWHGPDSLTQFKIGTVKEQLGAQEKAWDSKQTMWLRADCQSSLKLFRILTTISEETEQVISQKNKFIITWDNDQRDFSVWRIITLKPCRGVETVLRRQKRYCKGIHLEHKNLSQSRFCKLLSNGLCLQNLFDYNRPYFCNLILYFLQRWFN